MPDNESMSRILQQEMLTVHFVDSFEALSPDEQVRQEIHEQI
jgi:hypothetical protein